MEKETVEESRELKREGAAPTTQAGPFVHEEIEHIREGKHGAESTKQAIAIGLSKARRAGVKLPTPAPGRVSERTRKSIESAKRRAGRKPSPTRARAVRGALKREGRAAVSREALARQARSALGKRTAAERSASARRAVRTKGAAGRSVAARKAARTRKRRT
ncbi:MAG: DNA-binding protein [Elusimicrobia bacterium]|nr:DNA-binding protein [Elusimicrobiota bacterium]